MKKVIIIETAAELLNVAGKDREEGSDFPVLPRETKINFDFSVSPPEVDITADGFELSEELRRDPQGVLSALSKAAGFAGAIMTLKAMR